MLHARKSALAAAALAAAVFFAAPMGAALAQSASPAAPDPAANKPADPSNPNLVVATVKLDGGWRASKLIGATVYDDSNQRIGAVDDLIMASPGRISDAIISVGGFLGIGSKLIAVPYDHLRYDPSERDAKVVMPGATKDSLNQMPGFTYGNT